MNKGIRCASDADNGVDGHELRRRGVVVAGAEVLVAALRVGVLPVVQQGTGARAGVSGDATVGVVVVAAHDGTRTVGQHARAALLVVQQIGGRSLGDLLER